MDDVLAKQLIRQLKILNIWITIVGGLILAAIIICVILLFKVVTFVHHTADQVTNLEQKTSQNLNVKSKLCSNDSISQFLQNKSDVCQ